MSISQRYIGIGERQVPVTEEVYRAYKRPAWVERKRKEREQRCRDESGNRCNQDCSGCSKEHTGRSLSLERFMDQGFEIADPACLTEMVAERLLLEELNTALKELDANNRRIIELFSIGKTEREIAADIGMSQKAINIRKTKLFAQLRDRLINFI